MTQNGVGGVALYTEAAARPAAAPSCVPCLHQRLHRPPPPAGPVAPDVAGQVVTHMPPHEQWRRFVYCTGMTGEVLGMVDHFK